MKHHIATTIIIISFSFLFTNFSASSKTKEQRELVKELFQQGNELFALAKGKEAAATFRKILAINDNYSAVHHNLGFTLAERLGRHDEAIKHYHRALEIRPDNPEIHFCHALSCLATGNLQRGWQEYRYRWQRNRPPRAFGTNLTKQWSGQNLHGKTILLRCEQGLGDTLHFIRYAQLFKEQGAYIIAEIQKPLLKLFSLCPYLDRLIEMCAPLAFFDYQIPLLDIPAALETTLETIPQNIPYLYADERLKQKWHTYFKNNSSFKIGICWYGCADHGQIKFMPLKAFTPLFELPNVQIYSIQKFTGLDQIKDLPHHVTLHEFDKDFDTTHGSFMDTAAIMKQLDLIITADTSVAHLAGALGVPTWVLLPFPSEWRWLLNRTDSPWYPTMCLFRQKKPGGWNDVAQELKKELLKLLHEKK